MWNSSKWSSLHCAAPAASNNEKCPDWNLFNLFLTPVFLLQPAADEEVAQEPEGEGEARRLWRSGRKRTANLDFASELASELTGDHR